MSFANIAQPTHHHHDHAFGVKGYVENGAEVVCPKMAQSYYADIPGATFETFEYVVISASHQAKR